MAALVDVGLFHRLGIALRGDGDAPARWLAETVGAELVRSGPEPGDTHWTTILRIGPAQIALFAASPDDSSGTIARYVDRYGAGLHSLAWRVADLQGAEDRVRSQGLTVTGVNRAARHWFFHPKETFGILIELTDQGVGEPRPTAPTPGPARDIAWMTAVVGDVEAPRALFEELLGARAVSGLPAGNPEDEATVDLAIGDTVLRLAQPKSDRSRYASTSETATANVREVRRGLYSFTLRVDDLGHVPLPMVEQQGERGWSDPADTLGLRLEWTTVGPA
jgi:methylmalonyl-CoA/ethylmalonyl-CoA epimerase